MFDENNSQSPQIRITEGIPHKPQKPFVSKRRIWLLFTIAVIMILGALSLYVNSQLQVRALKKDLAKQQSNSNGQNKEVDKQLLEEVGKLIILPSGEQPTIATVSDLSKLKDKPFFNNAQIGDKVLIYLKAKKAILFRPSEHKIIELAPLVDGVLNNGAENL